MTRKKKEVTCIYCGEVIPQEDLDAGITSYGSIDGEPCHENCQSDAQNQTPYFFRDLQEKTEYHFDEHNGVTFNDDNGGDSLDHLPDPVKSLKYVRTSGWRGYHDFELKDGWKRISGWTTGYPDETVNKKKTLNSFFDWLTKQDVSFPVWLGFAQTSNIFSQGCDVIFKIEDTEKVKALAQSYGLDLDQIAELAA